MIVIDDTSPRQTMHGFGAGGCSLEAADDATWDLLFDRRTGLGLTILREYVDTRGHFNDGSENGTDAGNPPRNPPYPPGLDLQNAIKAAQRGVRFMAFSQWSPAAWRAEVSGTNKIPAAHYAEQAARVASFLQQAADNGITIDAYSPGNEPDSPPWGLLFTPAELHTFVHDYLVPAIAASAQPNCKVLLTESASSYSLASYINAFSAAGHLADIGYTSHHDYAQTPQIPAIGKPFWQTEASANSSGLYWARRIHDYVSAGASAYLYLFFWAPGWYNASPDAGLLGKYAEGKPLQKTALVFAQFSRWVRPGDVRIDCSGAPAGVYATAYKRGDGAFTVVLVNENAGATPVDLSGIPGGVGALARHETTEAAPIGAIGTPGNLAQLSDVAVAGGTASTILSARSVTTLWSAPNYDVSLTAPPLDGTASMAAPALALAAAASISAPASMPAPVAALDLRAAPFVSSATFQAPALALSASASLPSQATLPAPAATLAQAVGLAAEAGFVAPELAVSFVAAPLDGSESLPEPRQALHLGIVRRAALGSQQRRPWRIYDGRVWAEHRPRQFNGSTF